MLYTSTLEWFDGFHRLLSEDHWTDDEESAAAEDTPPSGTPPNDASKGAEENPAPVAKKAKTSDVPGVLRVSAPDLHFVSLNAAELVSAWISCMPLVFLSGI